jgi:hypothetical protein
MKLKICLAAAAIPFVAVSVQAQNLPLDPGKPLKHYSSNSNDGYSSYRGVVFTADESFQVLGADLWTKASGTLNATFELYEIVVTNGNVLQGATLVDSFNAGLIGDIGFHGGKFDTPIDMKAGQDYLLRVGYAEAADENWFFDFDPDLFGDPPVDIGLVTLIDGTLGGNTSTYVMPFMNLQIPAPGALALLGLAGLVGRRRR